MQFEERFHIVLIDYFWWRELDKVYKGTQVYGKVPENSSLRQERSWLLHKLEKLSEIQEG